MPATLDEHYYGVKYQADRYHDREAKNLKALSSSDSASSSPVRSAEGTEEYGQRMTVSDLELAERNELCMQSRALPGSKSDASKEEGRVVDEHVTATTEIRAQVHEELYAEREEENLPPLKEIIDTTVTTTSQTVEVLEAVYVAEEETDAFVAVAEEAKELVLSQETVVTCTVDEEEDKTDEDVETEVTTTTMTTTTTTTVILESGDETLPSLVSRETSGATKKTDAEQNQDSNQPTELSSITAQPESTDFGRDHTPRKDEESAAKVQSGWKKLLVGLPLLALTWAAACWLTPSSKFATISHSLLHSATTQWDGLLSKIGNPEAQIFKLVGWCSSWLTDVWNETTAGSALKTAWSKSSEKALHYTSSLYEGVCAAFVSVSDACASVWECVWPKPRDTSMIDSTRENLLDPFEADQQMLNDKLKQLLLKQEAWALEELKRMKKRRVAHASVTDSILSDTRAMVLESLQEAKLVAAYHIEAYTEAISEELIQSIQRELDEYDRSVREAQLEVEHGKHDLVETTKHELETLKQLKVETEQELDVKLAQDATQVVSAKEKLIQELAEIAASEKEKIEAEYQRVMNAVSQFEEAEDDRLEADLETVEKEVLKLATEEKEWIREEDTKLLDELELLAKLETMRIEVERERALLEVAQVAAIEKERIRQEREQAEALARRLEAEEQRLLVERQRAETEIAEAARLDALRLEEERKRAEDEILEALKREKKRIRLDALKAEEELVLIKKQEEELAQLERAKTEAAIAEAALVEEERLQRERDILAAQLVLEAELEQELLREERGRAEEALEQALDEEECKLCAQEKEGKQILDQAAEDIERTMGVVKPSADTGAVIAGGIKIEIVSEAEVIPLFLPDQEEMTVAELINASTMGSILPGNGSALGSMLRFPLSIPQLELYNVGLLSATFVVLGLITAYFLSSRYQRLLARRRQRAHMFHARRKRWQRRVESGGLDFAEEVVLLTSCPHAELNGNEPEPEVLGYVSDTYTVSEVATEGLSPTSSVEEQDDASVLTTISQSFTANEVANEDDEDRDKYATVTQQFVVQERHTIMEATRAGHEGENEAAESLPQNQLETPTRHSRRISTRRVISPTA